MLRWRLLLGTLIVAVLVGLCWLDHKAAWPGIYLFPLFVAGLWLATREVLDLAEAGGIRPVKWTVYLANLLLISVAWGAPLYLRFAAEATAGSGSLAAHAPSGTGDWILVALAVGVGLIYLAEMRRFERPGGVTANLAAAVFAVVYLGTLATFLIQIRMSWGIAGVASVILVTKMGDIGAYTVGRLIGRNRLAPGISPGKTIEGAVGALAFSVAASAATFLFLVPAMNPDARTTSWLGWAAYGIAVCISGMFGDLAESLIKRDVNRKDSGSRIPGFGGVLDIVDSLLFASPVAYAFWRSGMVG
ncbi:MAG: phosphatidate cytidylyltransferase [Pirellulales bacterium]|jgi:phosphatidate cytidylyltransferase|nr:phosphatidate cytidylyltransferase [Thermoguttaceae bacterium]MDD4786324.1 phosphatidate cytidylyltransferase [Pirellulales bacterium]MDI9446233.1 phosphatidate cytidylyltransferase [Planctomycetota bacterium]NLZ02762.1 phosphatidate cytidylyltransferase [Pirellulaceae bacterium]